jgi:hypothetical protein
MSKQSTDAKALLARQRTARRARLARVPRRPGQEAAGWDIQLAALTTSRRQDDLEARQELQAAFDAYRDDGLKQAHERFPDRKPRRRVHAVPQAG